MANKKHLLHDQPVCAGYCSIFFGMHAIVELFVSVSEFKSLKTSGLILKWQ